MLSHSSQHLLHGIWMQCIMLLFTSLGGRYSTGKFQLQGLAATGADLSLDLCNVCAPVLCNVQVCTLIRDL